jgi:perosamine synthetase
LQKKNIHAIIPIEKWELLDDFKKYPIAHKLTNESVSLPLYPSMTVSDVKEISKVVSNFLE